MRLGVSAGLLSTLVPPTVTRGCPASPKRRHSRAPGTLKRFLLAEGGLEAVAE